MTRFELAARTRLELQALYRASFNALVRSEPASAERRTALANLDNIEAELASRYNGS